LLDAIVAELQIPPERYVRIVHETGSVGAASIALSLDHLMRTRDVAPGDRLLMVAVGGGLAWGATLFQIGGSDR
jgi:3-oxoacyl-[acyl-carrier-protein] synthase III